MEKQELELKTKLIYLFYLSIMWRITGPYAEGKDAGKAQQTNQVEDIFHGD